MVAFKAACMGPGCVLAESRRRAVGRTQKPFRGAWYGHYRTRPGSVHNLGGWTRFLWAQRRGRCGARCGRSQPGGRPSGPCNIHEQGGRIRTRLRYLLGGARRERQGRRVGHEPAAFRSRCQSDQADRNTLAGQLLGFGRDNGKFRGPEEYAFANKRIARKPSAVSEASRFAPRIARSSRAAKPFCQQIAKWTTWRRQPKPTQCSSASPI
jgi:hypothetical protein